MQQTYYEDYHLKNKEFLQTNYPRGRTIGVFRSFYFTLWVKN